MYSTELKLGVTINIVWFKFHSLFGSEVLPIFGSPGWRISGVNWSQPASVVGAIYKLYRDFIADRAVWSDLVIVLTPIL